MTDTGIQDFKVTYHANGRRKNTNGQPIASISVQFGDGHSLEVSAANGKAKLRLVGHRTIVTLACHEPSCDFERAINILRLHMPRSGKQA